MITVKVSLLPALATSEFIDMITVTVEDSSIDRQPRHTFLEGIRRDRELITLTFTT